ncbi:macro domain-containing protein [Paraburkholderia sediminicola]|uniref:macro domain-containing protein n=1 Tax=Paraburkholderia sediminicola TaxID=458836 RepID=UPI0038B79215
MKIHLVDVNPEMVLAWQAAFDDEPAVAIYHGSIFGTGADTLVSPANSFGFMDGSLDLAISNRLGWHVQDRLQTRIRKEHGGELPVGCAIVVDTADEKIPFLISAPTMRVPIYLGPESINAYLATRAAFIAALSDERIRTVAISGMGTGVGRIPPAICAQQMRAAFDQVFRGTPFPDSWESAQRAHQRLYAVRTRDIQFKANAT